MTLYEFTTWLVASYPKADFRLSFDGTIKHVPARVEKWFDGSKETKPVRHEVEVDYHLTFQADYFNKQETEKSFSAPSLLALQTVLQGHYQHSVEQVCHELEGLK